MMQQDSKKYFYIAGDVGDTGGAVVRDIVGVFGEGIGVSGIVGGATVSEGAGISGVGDGNDGVNRGIVGGIYNASGSVGVVGDHNIGTSFSPISEIV